MDKERIDKLLVDLGFAASRQKAQALVLAGQVLVDNKTIDKPGAMIRRDTLVKVIEPPRYVSRGGVKLENALREFGVVVKDKICLDIGASTGGFTDCLLQFGARRVFALDVGRGQLDWKLRSNPKVTIIEGVNIRYLDPRSIPQPVDMVTIDVSFISLTLVLPAVRTFLQSKARGSVELVVLIKPQFEVGKGKVGKGGIIKDKAQHQEVIQKISNFAREIGFHFRQVIESCMLGAEGNTEFFIHLEYD